MKKTGRSLIMITLILLMTGFNKKPLIVAFGDSNTAGSNWAQNNFNPSLKWIEKLNAHYDVVNAGIGGNTSLAGLKRFKKDVLYKKRRPAVTIMFGTNDAILQSNGRPRVSKAQFENNLRYFVKTIKQSKGKPILMTSIPIIEGNSKKFYYSRHNEKLYMKHGGARKWHDSYNDIVRKVAKEENVLLVDHFHNIVRWAHGENDANLQKSGLIDPSGTHFTPAGADILYRGIKQAFKTGRGPAPNIK